MKLRDHVAYLLNADHAKRLKAWWNIPLQSCDLLVEEMIELRSMIILTRKQEFNFEIVKMEEYASVEMGL